MSRSFNMENVSRLKVAVAQLEEIPAVGAKGVNNTVDLAVKQNAPKFLTAAKNMSEKFDALVASTGELVEVNSRIQSKYAGIQEAL
jgi:hypothetical protein